MRYLDLGPDLIADILPEAIQRLAPESLAKVWRLVEEFSQLKAWQLQMIPFYRLGTRLAVILPTLLALLALFWLPFGVVMGGRRISKAIGAVLCGLSLWALIILLGALPELDALGASTQREWSFVVVLLGVRLGNGVWFTVVGLLLLVAGGIVEIVTPGPRRPLPQPLRGIW